MTSVFNITNIKLVFYKALIHSYFASGLQYEIEVLKARISQEREKLRVIFFSLCLRCAINSIKREVIQFTLWLLMTFITIKQKY